MDENNIFNNYETTEFKMSNDSDGCSSSRNKTYQSSQDQKISKNGLYYHEPNGSKSFGVGTMILILVTMAVGIGLALSIQDKHPLIGAGSCIVSLIIVFKGILGGKRPKD